MDKLKNTIDFTTNSNGQLEKALNNSSNATDEWNKVLNNLKFIGLQIGNKVLPVINFGLKTLNNGLEFVILLGQKTSSMFGFIKQNSDALAVSIIAGTTAWAAFNLQASITLLRTLPQLAVGMSALAIKTGTATAVSYTHLTLPTTCCV